MVDVKEVRTVLRKYFRVVGKVKINPEGVVDVMGLVELKKTTEKLPVQFGVVSNEFNISGNLLTSLVGSPRHVGGNFNCYSNRLTSWEGAPTHVAKHVWAKKNKFTNLIGVPEYVGGNLGCSDNLLTSLEGFPTQLQGGFWGNSNQLTDLTGAPSHMIGFFYCYDNPLTSLTGAPAHVDKFICSYKPQLPLLQLLKYQDFQINNCPAPVYEILNKHAGEGKAGAIKAAGELIRAGFKENARW
jgi:hypothetical protein